MAKKNLQSVADELGPLAATMPTQRPASQAIARSEPSPTLAPVPPPATPSPEKERAYTMNMRLSLHRQLDRLASDAAMTMKAFVLDALKVKGLDVRPEDLVDRRGNRPKRNP